MAKEGIGTVQMSLTGEPYYNETLVPIERKRNHNLQSWRNAGLFRCMG